MVVFSQERVFISPRNVKRYLKCQHNEGKSEKATSQETLPVQTPDLRNQEVAKAVICLAKLGVLLVVAIPEAERELPALLRKWRKGAVSRSVRELWRCVL